MSGIRESIIIPCHRSGARLGVRRRTNQTEGAKGKVSPTVQKIWRARQLTTGKNPAKLLLEKTATKPLWSGPCWAPFLPLSFTLFCSVGLCSVSGAHYSGVPCRIFHLQPSLLGTCSPGSRTADSSSFKSRLNCFPCTSHLGRPPPSPSSNSAHF